MDKSPALCNQLLSVKIQASQESKTEKTGFGIMLWGVQEGIALLVPAGFFLRKCSFQIA
jgi:hypothetical protein